MARFTVEDIKNRKASSKSDLERLRNMTEDEIHQAALDDPDAQPLTEEQLKQFTRVIHRGGGVYGHDKTKSIEQRASK
jgi:glycine cleavage system protein P-like pyridoxal-binding family